jgi:hypothetical protein
MNSVPFEIPFARQFFSGYLVDHFLYKQFTLFNAIEKFPKLKSDILDGLDEVVDSDYEKSLRIEIRATYLQAVETLFELIFSLEPRGAVIDNRNIWYSLSTSEWRKNYERIESIAKGETDFLDRVVTAGKELKVPFIQYLFYFGVTNPSMLDAVKASFDPIKKFLRTFADEFSDRQEYNAFKHALRIFPTLTKFEVGPHGSDKPIISWDMARSMTYLTEEDDGSVAFRTKPLDTERDMRMGLVCSYLISNIVRSRKAHFVKDYQGHLHTFTEESFPSANERAIKWLNLKLTIKPVYNESINSDSKNDDRAGV